MIVLAGERWATAAEVAEHLGGGVTTAMVRSWARRDGLASVRVADDCGRPQVRYLLSQAAAVDLSKRRSGRGRRRVA